ncbi:hypothetical protein PINS_up024102 [Pythium insidiosum]|nr:hypothetical protein PINS_up024102 [Pythium insidiosum]
MWRSFAPESKNSGTITRRLRKSRGFSGFHLIPPPRHVGLRRRHFPTEPQQLTPTVTCDHGEPTDPRAERAHHEPRLRAHGRATDGECAKRRAQAAGSPCRSRRSAMCMTNHKYVVLSEWKSQKDYDNWVNSEDFKKCTEKINEVLDVPGKRTTIFKRPNEDIFLL